MKRLILTTFLCFILCMSFPINALATSAGVGSAGGAVGSNIDPRADSRYKDAFSLNCEKYGGYDSDMQVLRESNSTVYKDVVIRFTKDYDGKKYALKGYLRIYYVQEEYNNPSGMIGEGTNAASGTKYFDLVCSKPKVFYYVIATENVDGTFSVSNTVENISSRSMWTWLENLTIESSDIPLFENLTDAKYYSETNQVRGALYDPDPKDYSSELYFKSFEVVPHVSNSAEYYYFDIQYELSDYAKKNIDKLNLNFENCYHWESSDVVLSVDGITETDWFSNSISLKDNPYGFSIVVSDIGCIVYAHNIFGMSYSNIIGIDKTCDLINTALKGLIFEKLGIDLDIVYISRADLYFRFNLRFSGSNGVVLGKRNNFTWDFINKKLEKSIYTPDTTTDSNGNTTVVKDSNGNITYTQEGDKVTSNDYYYNKVTETQEGDTVTTVNNYFYYDKDGKQQEISEKEYNDNAYTKVNAEGGNASAEGGSAIANAAATIGDIIINVPPTGGSTSDNITINDDDLTSDGLIKAISHGFGYFDNIDTGEKGDGLIALISYLYGYLPQDLSYMTLFGLATVFGISIIRIITKR